MTRQESEEELFNRLKYTAVERSLIRLKELLMQTRQKHGRAQKDDSGRGSGGDNSKASKNQG